ncbi:MAG TPA: glucose 1-dehydrogenase [Blastocatellia bacterium]|nr:glucose 1-dehydrogenase [Blastocatellia bacterium]
MTFQGKVALITGGGTGIGRATAESLIALGARVVINGRRGDVLTRTRSQIDASGQRVIAVAGDIADPATASRMVEAAMKHFGGVDLLINNAGIFKPAPFLEQTAGEVEAYLSIILKGTIYASQAAIPPMQQRGGGAIVNVGSMWASQAIGLTPSSAYSAAKAGVHALTRNLAIELAKDRIRVNTVAPAVVETPVYETFLPREQVAEVLSGFNAFHPLGRNGQPRDVAAAILFLASDEASWITGTLLAVDGGVTAGR